MSQALDRIRSFGFADVKAFQLAWNLGPSLVVDGLIGPKTTAAVNQSWIRRSAGLPTLSTHYSASEFACKHCHVVVVHRELIRSLENTRSILSHTIISGYRCPVHNAAVGGAHDSMHLYGLAADVAPTAHVLTVRMAHQFAGIGYSPTSGHVVHVDRRDLHPGVPQSVTVNNPQQFTDGP